MHSSETKHPCEVSLQTENVPDSLTATSRSRELHRFFPMLGALLCSATAALLSILLQNNSFKAVLPICFLVVIVLVSICFGTLAGTLGTILAQIIFAVLLFEPLRSLAVDSQAARNSLIWMFLGGMALAELCGQPSPKK